MASPELVTVYTVSNAIEAEIIKNALVAEGIPCMIEGEHQAGDAGLIGISIKLQVPSDQADAAREFIAAHEHKGTTAETDEDEPYPEDAIEEDK